METHKCCRCGKEYKGTPASLHIISGDGGNTHDEVCPSCEFSLIVGIFGDGSKSLEDD